MYVSGPVCINGQHLAAVEKDAESEDEEKRDVKLLCIPESNLPLELTASFHRKIAKLAADEDDDDKDKDDDFEKEEAKEKAPIKKSM